jgi:hypothetical protein
MDLMNPWLLSLRDEEITQAISAWFDGELWLQIPKKLQAIVFDLDLCEQALHLQKCGFDRMYAQLTWKGPN